MCFRNQCVKQAEVKGYHVDFGSKVNKIKRSFFNNSRSNNNQDCPIRIVITLVLTGMVSIILTSAMALILAESNLPKPIKRLSYTLIHDRSKRFTVIWITFFFMCVATTLAVVSILLICIFLRL